MKLIKKISVALFASLLVVTSFSCASVERVNPNKDIELDGYWSDYDVKLVCNDIIDQVIASPRIAKKEKEMGRTPIVTIGNIENASDEFIDTQIVADKLETAILNSGSLEFIASKGMRDDLRAEIADQADHAKPSQAKEFDNEDAADFMLAGSVRTMVQNDRVIGKEFRTYFVTIDLYDIESARVVGKFQPSEEVQPRKLISGKLR